VEVESGKEGETIVNFSERADDRSSEIGLSTRTRGSFDGGCSSEVAGLRDREETIFILSLRVEGVSSNGLWLLAEMIDRGARFK
jgi:hypothetical protein